MEKVPNARLFIGAISILLFNFFGLIAHAQVPKITSISSFAGPIGSSITISGSDFDPDPIKNKVFFGGISGTVTAGTANSLTVTVPQGADAMPITVTNTVSGRTVNSYKSFMVTASVKPEFVKQDFGSEKAAFGSFKPLQFAVGDLNGDGVKEIVALDYATAEVSVTTVDKTSLVSSHPLKFSTGLAPVAMVLADFDGDGKLDIITANQGAKTISVLINNSVGSVSYKAAVDISVNEHMVSLAVADIDLDGKPDLIYVFGANTNMTLAVMLNTTTSGAISADPASEIAVESNHIGLRIVDLDGDGKPEIISYTNQFVNVYQNNTSVGNVTGVTLPLHSAQILNDIKSVELSDLNGRGKPHIVVLYDRGNYVRIQQNFSVPGDLIFRNDLILISGETEADYLAVGDLNADGRPEIIVSKNSSYSFYAAQNIDAGGQSMISGSFAHPTRFDDGVSDVKNMLVVDLTGDGQSEIVQGHELTYGLSIRKNEITTLPTIQARALNVIASQTSATISWTNGNGGARAVFVTNATNSTAMPLNNFTYTGNSEFGLGSPIGANDWYCVYVGSRNTVNVKGLSNNTNYRVMVLEYKGAVNRQGFLKTQSSDNSQIFTTLAVPPAITAFSPESGPIGTSVTITGTGFDPVNANNIVFFGATKAMVTSGNATSLVVNVPRGASFEAITVLNTQTKLMAYTEKPFMPIFTPASKRVYHKDFQESNSIQVNAKPHGMAYGDLNGDGKPDLVVVSQSGAKIGVMLNNSTNSSPTFDAKIDLTTGSSPMTVVIKDLDGDGKPDLVTANAGSDNVSIFRNTSVGGVLSFDTRLDIYVGSTPMDVIVRDLNGDGKPDLIAANNSDNTITIFQNGSTSSGISFVRSIEYFGLGAVQRIAVDDLNQDGLPDIVVSSGIGKVFIFENVGVPGSVLESASFKTPIELVTGTGTNDISIADLDNDGLPDLVVSVINHNKLMIFKNTQLNGKITFAQGINYSFGFSPYFFTVGDLNGDGKPDIVLANLPSNNIEIMQNKSVNGVIDALSFEVTGRIASVVNQRRVSVVDLNGDGMPEIVASSDDSGGKLVVLKNDLIFAPTVQAESLTSTATNLHSTTLQWTPGNGQNRAVFVALNPTSDPLPQTDTQYTANAGFAKGGQIGTSGWYCVYKGNGSSATINSLARGETYLAMVIEYNGDAGREAYLTTSNGTNKKSFTMQMLPVINSFTPATAKPGATGLISGLGFNPTASDNIVFIGATQAVVTSASFTQINYIVPAGATHQPISVTDRTTRLTGRSSRPFVPTFKTTKTTLTKDDFGTQITKSGYSNPTEIVAGDMNGDGKPDLIFTQMSSNLVVVLLNTTTNGVTSFGTGVELTTGSAPKGVAVSDFNGDGKLDIVVANLSSNSVYIWENTTANGNLSFGNSVSMTTGAIPYAVAVGDLDDDGLTDIVVTHTGPTANSIGIIRNKISTGTINSSSFEPPLSPKTGIRPHSIAIGDLDGDGKVDLATANHGAGTISIFRNTNSNPGVVALSARIDIPVGINPTAISFGDIDGDGKLDLIVTNYGSGTVSILRNISTAGSLLTSSFSPKVDIQTLNFPLTTAVADVTGDGIVDISVSNEHSNSVQVFANGSNGTTIGFDPAVTFLGSSEPRGLTIADFNDDGLPDWAFVNSSGGVVAVQEYNPSSLSISGTLSAVNISYGTETATPTSFTVSGTKLKSGITVTPPAGFEVSKTPGGASGYAGSGNAITIGDAGDVSLTTLFVRLAKTTDVGDYSGNIEIVTDGIATKFLATALSKVTVASVSIQVNKSSKIYGSSPLVGAAGSTAFTATGLKNAETIGTVTTVFETGAGSGNSVSDPVGTYTGKASVSGATGGTFNPNNYSITYLTNEIEVTPAALSLTIKNVVKVYGNTLNNFNATNFTSTGLLNGETIDGISLSFSGGHEATDPVGFYTNKANGSTPYGGTFTATNYAITYIPGNVIVTQAPLEITANPGTRTYGKSLKSTPGSTDFIVSGLKNNDKVESVTFNYIRGNQSADQAGVYQGSIYAASPIGATFVPANYDIVFNPGSLTVNPAPLTIYANVTSKVYGSQPRMNSSYSTEFTTSAMFNNESVNSVQINYPGTAGQGNLESDPVGTYNGAVSISNAGGNFHPQNYQITYVSGNIVVTPAPLEIVAEAHRRRYGEALKMDDESTKGFVGYGLRNGETIGSATLVLPSQSGTGATTTDPVGIYPAQIVVKDASGGTFNASNYDITYKPGDIEIMRALLFVSASTLVKFYGDEPNVGGPGSTAFTTTGLKNSETVETVTINYLRGPGTGNERTEKVGYYQSFVEVSDVKGGTYNPNNYDVIYEKGSIIVNKAPLYVTPNKFSRSYGSNPIPNNNLSTDFTVNGLKNSETVGTVKVMFDPAIGRGNTATDRVNIYEYSVRTSDAKGGTFLDSNYELNYNTGSIEVIKAPITVSASAVSRIYGNTPHISGWNPDGFSVTGMQNNEKINMVKFDFPDQLGEGNHTEDAVGTYKAKATISSITGPFASDNYAITYIPVDMIVTPAPLTIVANNSIRTYGSATFSGGTGYREFNAIGLKNGETIGTVMSIIGSTPGSGNHVKDPAGTYPGKIHIENAIGGTFKPSNYVISYFPGGITIRQTELIINITPLKKVYGSTPFSGETGYVGFTVDGLKNGETIGSVTSLVGINVGSGNHRADAVGTYADAISAHSATGGTFNAANYFIKYGLSSITVTKAPLVITADNKSRAYGMSNPEFSATYTGFVNGENQSVLTTRPIFTTSASTTSSAGNYDIHVDGAIAVNYSITYKKGILSISSNPNVAPTLAFITNQEVCADTGPHSIPLSGISAGPEAGQRVTLSVLADNPDMFSQLSVIQGVNGDGTVQYVLNPGVSGVVNVRVTVQDDGGIDFGGNDSFSRTFAIKVNTIPQVTIASSLGTEISKGATTVLTATGGTKYVWTNAFGTIGSLNEATLTIRPTETATYSVTVTNSSGCISRHSVTIKVLDDFKSVVLTNVMSPNGDGKNDALIIKNLDMYPNNTLKVFNRAGKIVYQVKGYANDWVGTHNGAPLPEDTYYYILEFGTGKGALKGFVSILRSK